MTATFYKGVGFQGVYTRLGPGLYSGRDLVGCPNLSQSCESLDDAINSIRVGPDALVVVADGRALSAGGGARVIIGPAEVPDLSAPGMGGASPPPASSPTARLPGPEPAEARSARAPKARPAWLAFALIALFMCVIAAAAFLATRAAKSRAERLAAEAGLVAQAAVPLALTAAALA